MIPRNHQKTVKIQAKDLVRTRQYVTKFYEMRSQLQAISLRLEVGLLCILPMHSALSQLLSWCSLSRLLNPQKPWFQLCRAYLR
jgi:hypothetical protein